MQSWQGILDTVATYCAGDSQARVKANEVLFPVKIQSSQELSVTVNILFKFWVWLQKDDAFALNNDL